MKYTTDHYGHRTTDLVDGDTDRIYLTDDTGTVWCVYPSDGGLQVSPIAPIRRGAIFTKALASNVLIVQAREHGDTP